MWERTYEGDKRRSETDRKKCLHHIAASKEWIIEGVHYTWVNESFNRANLIMFQWNADFEKQSKPEILHILRTSYNDKLIIVKKREEIEHFIS